MTTKKYKVSRIVQLLQVTTIKAKSPSEAIELARKSKFKDWTTVDNKRRKNYEAAPIQYQP